MMARLAVVVVDNWQRSYLDFVNSGVWLDSSSNFHDTNLLQFNSFISFSAVNLYIPVPFVNFHNAVFNRSIGNFNVT